MGVAWWCHEDDIDDQTMMMMIGDDRDDGVDQWWEDRYGGDGDKKVKRLGVRDKWVGMKDMLMMVKKSDGVLLGSCGW